MIFPFYDTSDIKTGASPERVQNHKEEMIV